MRIIERFKEKTVLSFEVFPPKPDMPVDTIYKTLDGLKELQPDFISVTYFIWYTKKNKRISDTGLCFRQ